MNVKSELLKHVDKKYLAFSQRLITTSYPLLGVRIPIQRQIAKRIAKEEGLIYLNSASMSSYEEINIAAFVLGLSPADRETRLFYLEWITKYMDNWSAIDGFVASLKWLKKDQEFYWSYVKKYLNSEQEFYRREALVLSMTYYLDDKYIDEVLFSLDKGGSQEYYSLMAIAWYLATAAVYYSDRIYNYLKENRLSVWVHNKAIQKMKESYRINDEDKKRFGGLKRYE